jgi:hypothetical protein
VVIVGALVGERLILEYLDKRREAAVDYEIARRECEGYRRSPERHPDYQRHLYLRVMEVYRRRLSSGELDNPEVARALYARDLTVFAQPNFTQLPLPAEPTVASTDE